MNADCATATFSPPVDARPRVAAGKSAASGRGYLEAGLGEPAGAIREMAEVRLRRRRKIRSLALKSFLTVGYEIEASKRKRKDGLVQLRNSAMKETLISNWRMISVQVCPTGGR